MGMYGLTWGQWAIGEFLILKAAHTVSLVVSLHSPCLQTYPCLLLPPFTDGQQLLQLSHGLLTRRVRAQAYTSLDQLPHQLQSYLQSQRWWLLLQGDSCYLSNKVGFHDNNASCLAQLCHLIQTFLPIQQMPGHKEVFYLPLNAPEWIHYKMKLSNIPPF